MATEGPCAICKWPTLLLEGTQGSDALCRCESCGLRQRREATDDENLYAETAKRRYATCLPSEYASV